MNNQITLFMKKKNLKYWFENCTENFDTKDFENNITDGSKKLYERKDNIVSSTLSNFYVSNYKFL